MRAVFVSRHGGPEVLHAREVPDPTPGSGDLLVDVQVVEVLFLDTQLRAGWGQDFFPMRPPFVPGTGVGGTVGPRRVVARTGNEGGYAGRVAVPAREAIDVPDGLDLAVALAAVHDGVLAQHRLALTPLGAGARVLVTAAAGSVGHWIIPLARAAGATVTAAVGGPAKLRAVREIGANVAVDYRQEGWIDQADGPFDVVFDGAGGALGRTALDHTVDGGSFHAYGSASGEFATVGDRRDIEVVGVEQAIDDETWRHLIRDGLQLLAAQQVRPAVGLRVPLERADEAHAAIGRREVVGKTVLTL